MKRKRLCWIIALLTCLLSLPASAQYVVNGLVHDEHQEPLSAVMIKAFDATEHKMLGYTLSDKDGKFRLTIKQAAEKMTLQFSAMGFQPVEKPVTKQGDMGGIIMRESESLLKEVTVKAPTVRTMGDTITYSVDQLKEETDKTIEDVIRKLPGIEVDENGKISYNDRPINKFYIEGADMLGGRYTLASRNIQADDIATVSIYENHQPIKALSGIELSDQAALNLSLKRDRTLKPIGNVTIGTGYGNKALWEADANMLLIAPKKQFLITAKGNDTGIFYDGEMTDHNTNSSQYAPYSLSLLRPVTGETPRVPRSRSQDNQSAATTFNSLLKLNDEATLVINAGYHYDHLGNRQEKLTTYWQEGTDGVVVDEISKSQSSAHQGWLTIKLESNKKQSYILEQLDAEGSLRDWRDKFTDRINIMQNITTHSYRISNTLNTVWRKADRAFDFSSQVSFGNVPHSNLEAMNTNLDSLLVMQHVDGMRFYTKEQTSHKWLIGKKVTLSANASFQADYDRLGSNFTYKKEMGLGQYEGYRLQTTFFPSLTLPMGKLTGSVDMLIQMNNIHYNDCFTDQRFAYDKPYAGIQASFQYRISKNTKLQFGGSSSRKLGTMLNFIVTPIYVNYRSRCTFGTGILDYKDKVNANVGITYREVLSGVNASLLADYQHSRGNILSGNYISNDVTSTFSQNKDNNIDLFNIRGQVSRNFYELHTILSLSASASLHRSQALRQESIYKTANDAYTIDGNIQTVLFDKHVIVNAACLYVLTAQKIYSSPDGSTLLNDFTPSLSITILPHKSLSIYLRANGSYIQNTNVEAMSRKYNGSLFMDAGVRYKWKRFEWECIARNLTNRKKYESRVLDLLDAYTYTYFLRPIEFKNTLKWTF